VEPAGQGGQEEKAFLPTLPELLEEGINPREIRFWLISGHYRKPITFAPERLFQARSALNRLDACVWTLSSLRSGTSYPETDQLVYDIRQGFVHAMDEDLNLPHALAAIFTSVRRINRLLDEGRLAPADAAKLIDAFKEIDQVLRIFSFTPPQMDKEIEDLLESRRRARIEGDFKEADRIRHQLIEMGVKVHDERIERR
jgi:cysteinyl-tRNA synthetase